MKSLHRLLLMGCIALALFPNVLMGQRKMESLDRGVVAIPKSASEVYISWRHFATDPDDIAYNVYYKVSAAAPSTKINAAPITRSTNYTARNLTQYSDLIFYVTSIRNGEEQPEAGSFTLKRNSVASRIVRDFTFAPLPAGHPKMPMKFCWPADLNGDGEYDFVLDRQNYGAVNEDGSGGSGDYPTPKVEAYTSQGTFLWRVDMGYNIKICNGHNDMVTAYDMDSDGKAEVLMAVSEGTTFADGSVLTGTNGSITDYRNRQGSAPQWLSIVDGETGTEIDRVEIPFFKEMATTRTDSWKDLGGHFIIAYLDGIHPSLIYQYTTRQSSGDFTGSFAAWRFIDKKLVPQWSTRYYPEQEGADFHQVRVADIDGDGCDEFVEGGYTIDHDGKFLAKYEGAVHGDRHALADIDPDRPGLEHFIIQQNNPKTLGMALYDGLSGSMIKGIYQQAVADVGRGLCGAFDPSRRGLQFWSTMNNQMLYDCKGNLIEGSTGSFPSEALWWGPDLNRWEISGIGNGGPNLAFHQYNPASKTIDRVLPNLYNENNGNGGYYFRAAYGGRAAFWGDLLGDWREEVVCVRSDTAGFVVLSTWDETTHRIYHLMQNPAYRCQTTARGYYQTPDVDFYLAADMPDYPVAPVQKADLYYTGNGWMDETGTPVGYTDNKTIMFDLRIGNSNITLDENLSPSRLWLMNPKGKDCVFSGTGKFTGSMDVIKSMQGKVTLNGDHDYSGISRISEGSLYINGSIESTVQVDARGIIGGNAFLKGGIILRPGLNTEGSRIEPGNGSNLGKINLTGNLNLTSRNNLAFDIDQSLPAKNDSLCINGDFLVEGNTHSLIVRFHTPVQSGELTLITFTGTTNATKEQFSILGLEGIPYSLAIEGNSIKIRIEKPREAKEVSWSGKNSAVWDFKTKNFLLGDAEEIFVPGDTIFFRDDALNKTITIQETLPVGGLSFINDTDYKITGSGIISGKGGLKKQGTGKLSILTNNNSFTGGIEIENSVLEVSLLANGATPSSIGASSSNAANWIMRNAGLQTSSQMATDRSMTLYGKLTVNNPTTSNSILISGDIKGNNSHLEVTGKGTLALQGRNTLNEVTVKEGLLLLGSADANRYSMGSAIINLLGGTFRMHDINETTNTGTFSNALHVPQGASARWDLPQRWGTSGKLTGTGTLTVNVPYVRSDLNGDWSAFTGKILFTGRDVRLNSTVARNMPNAEINLGSGTYLMVASNGSGESSGSFTITLGALSGSGGIAGKHKLVIGDKGINTVYSGSIGSGAGSLVKRGNGSLQLTGNNQYTGITTIESGTLIVSNTTGSATGSGKVTVNRSAALTGTGIISGSVELTSGGMIMPGESESKIGKLNINSNLILNTGSKMVIKTGNTGNDRIAVNLNLLLSGTLEMKNSGVTYAAGNTYTIFEVKGTVNGAFEQIVPATPGEGLVWDTSRINEGIISVGLLSSIESTDSRAFSIYPTFVEKSCFIEWGDRAEGEIRIDVINQLGVIVKSDRVSVLPAIYELDLSAFEAGMYYLRVSDKLTSTAHKVIKRRP